MREIKISWTATAAAETTAGTSNEIASALVDLEAALRAAVQSAETRRITGDVTIDGGTPRHYALQVRYDNESNEPLATARAYAAVTQIVEGFRYDTHVYVDARCSLVSGA